MVLRGIFENDSCQIFSQNNSNDQSFLLWHSGQQKKIRFDENSFFQIDTCITNWKSYEFNDSEKNDIWCLSAKDILTHR